MNEHLIKACGIVCVFLLAGFKAISGILTGPIINPANGYSYYLLSQNSWTGSEAEANSLGGHLATIRDQTENDWLLNTFGNFGGTPRCLWIGLTDAAHEGLFIWSSGEPVSYTNWQLGQPDSAGGAADEDYVHLLPPGHYNAGAWNDFQNINSVYFPDVPAIGQVPMNGVVEIVPEPATIWQFLVGLFFARRFKRFRNLFSAD